MSEEVIQQASLPSSELGAELPIESIVNMRGHRFKIHRDRLLSLPENILFTLSTGFNYNEPDAAMEAEEAEASSAGTPLYNHSSEDDIAADFSPECFEYILKTFGQAEVGMEPRHLSVDKFEDDFMHAAPPEAVSYFSRDSASETETMFEYNHQGKVPEVLRQRPAIVSLREDLEYYCMNNDLDYADLHKAKIKSGAELVNRNLVFDGLRQKDIYDSPEFHLMQMLVLSGFDPEGKWAYRQREPARTALFSFNLIPLSIPDTPDQETIQALHKLLLFWKKPAKKCWWDKFDLDLEGIGVVSIHARRVWTLELSILGLV